MATITITRGSSLPNSASKTDFHNLIDTATGTLSGTITGSDISASAGIVGTQLSTSANIADTQLAQITTASKVHGSSITGLASLPSGAGVIPSANLPTVTVYGGAVGSYKNLVVAYASTSTFTVTADEIVLEDSSNVKRIVRSLSGTVSLASNGAVNKLDTGTVAANTIYYVWAISNGTTDGALASLSSTAPTLPSGYTYKALISAVGTNNSSNLLAFKQYGRRYCFTNWPTMASGSSGGTTWTSADLTPSNMTTNAGFVPSAISNFAFGVITQSSATCQIGNDSSVSDSYAIAPNSIRCVGNTQATWALDIITADTLYYISNDASFKLYLQGFEINKLT